MPVDDLGADIASNRVSHQDDLVEAPAPSLGLTLGGWVVHATEVVTYGADLVLNNEWLRYNPLRVTERSAVSRFVVRVSETYEVAALDVKGVTASILRLLVVQKATDMP
jgi:hypothetical protein